MNICAQCGLFTVQGPSLCLHHSSEYDADWAAGNRAVCDFFHRRKEPRAPTKEERDFGTLFVVPSAEGPAWTRELDIRHVIRLTPDSSRTFIELDL